MNTISLVVITKNSEKMLAACLGAAGNSFAEIVVVDDFSTDQTAAVARKFNAKIFHKKLSGFGEQKQFALDQAGSDWIFLLDSDERISPELLVEIKEIISRQDGARAAYRAPRRNYYFGRWLKRGAKYPDYQTRLYKNGLVRFSSDIVHEKLIVQGTTGTLRSPIEHDSYPDLETWLSKLKLFAEFKAEVFFRGGLKPSWVVAVNHCFFIPCIRLFRRYFLKLGFLDGIEGFMAVLHDALTEILAYFLLVQKVKRQKT